MDKIEIYKMIFMIFVYLTWVGCMIFINWRNTTNFEFVNFAINNGATEIDVISWFYAFCEENNITPSKENYKIWLRDSRGNEHLKRYIKS